MRAIVLESQEKNVTDFEEINAAVIREVVGGRFHGIPLPSPDTDLPEEKSSMFLYLREDPGRSGYSNFRLGWGGRLVRGSAIIVGLDQDRNRDLTDHEIQRTTLTVPLTGALPLLEIRGHRFR